MLINVGGVVRVVDPWYTDPENDGGSTVIGSTKAVVVDIAPDLPWPITIDFPVDDIRYKGLSFSESELEVVNDEA